MAHLRHVQGEQQPVSQEHAASIVYQFALLNIHVLKNDQITDGMGSR